jgi:hypothetical protein
MSRPNETRLGPARRRAVNAKLALAAAAISVFLAATVLARVAYPGHTKRHSRALSPPQRFVQIVRKNALQAGMLAPAQAPPEATSAPT